MYKGASDDVISNYDVLHSLTLIRNWSIVVYRLLLGKDLFHAFNVVQSTYNNCYNTHSIPDTGVWP